MSPGRTANWRKHMVVMLPHVVKIHDLFFISVFLVCIGSICSPWQRIPRHILRTGLPFKTNGTYGTTCPITLQLYNTVHHLLGSTNLSQVFGHCLEYVIAKQSTETVMHAMNGRFLNVNKICTDNLQKGLENDRKKSFQLSHTRYNLSVAVLLKRPILLV